RNKLSKARPGPPGSLINGELIDVEFEVPANSRAVLFWLGTSGTLKEHETEIVDQGKTGPRLRYPRKNLVRIIGPTGTEFVLVVASRNGRPLPSLGQMEQLLAETCGKGPLPKLRPDDPQLLLTRDRVAEGHDPRDPGEEVDTPVSLVRSRLEALRR